MWIHNSFAPFAFLTVSLHSLCFYVLYVVQKCIRIPSTLR